MSIPTLLLLAVALGTDAFSLCLGIGMTGVRRLQILLITLTVLLFHIAMPLLGFQAGELVGGFLGRAATIAGAVLLLYLGLRMIREAFSREEPRIVLLNNWGLFLLGASVSMDALSVGFTLGTLRTQLLFTVLTFGLVAGLMTFSGLVLGRYLGHIVGERARLLGGLILVGIGVKLFL
ncbi:manganese efflux pump MntP [Desulfofundulus salinus]|uniref:Putative manganese efflux pump MntP n=1 Tax=Desulfofundulus salinus TaxID=2419843 RepID=A0A494WYC1_9FIRM|nr:manganese efflux pump MntP family protein [Desulfofundulus salinum]RKO65620.1 manganese efflux pump [Desulfofundulus salinum]